MAAMVGKVPVYRICPGNIHLQIFKYGLDKFRSAAQSKSGWHDLRFSKVAILTLSVLGVIAFFKKNIKILFLYLFLISTFLELSHILVPQRNFEYKDLFGNILGVLIIFLIFYIYNFFKKKNL